MPAGRGGRLAPPFATLALATLALFATANITAAATLGAAYGDKDGCRYAKTGESSGADGFLLLTDESLTTSTAVCSFAAPLRKTKSGFEGTATCEAEGESGEAEKVEITKSAKGYTIAFADGTRYGPLPKCR